MNLIRTFLFCALAVAGFARIVDNAGLLTSSEVTQLGQWAGVVTIETVSSVGDLKGYGDKLAYDLSEQERSTRPVYSILVTTNPRAWRISVYPQDANLARATQAVGERMASQFKRGRFYDGFRNAAAELSVLQPVAPVSVAPSEPALRAEENSIPTWFWILAIFGVGIISIVFYVIHKRQQEEADRRWEEQQRQYRAQQARREAERVKRYEEQQARLKISQAAAAKTFTLEKEKVDTNTKRAAQKAWDSYPTTKRREVIHSYWNHPNYHDGILNDPVAFYLFMQAVSPSQTTYVEPPKPTRSISRDDDSSSSYSSYSSSSSSSSWDSGGSSGSWDSGSSSSFDSGGSSGSW